MSRSHKRKRRQQTRSTPVDSGDVTGNGASSGRHLFYRPFSLRADTLDTDSRSVEAVIATERRVRVMDWREYEVIEEILTVDGLRQPSDQVPLLTDHYRSLDSQVGSVRSIRKDAPNVVGRLYFLDDDPAAERAYKLVSGKHTTDVSVGTTSERSEDLDPGETREVNGQTYTAGTLRLRVATEWTIRETSLVPIGADEAAKIRSAYFDGCEHCQRRARADAIADRLNQLISEEVSDTYRRCHIIDDLAGAAGVTPSFVSRVLSAREDASTEQLDGFGRVLDVSADELVGVV